MEVGNFWSPLVVVTLFKQSFAIWNHETRITWRFRENTETEVKEAKLDQKPLTAMELDDAAWGEPKGPTPGSGMEMLQGGF